ncbi:MAG: CRISPR-associated endonuclease Cas1 [Candidatus Dadabacteria bacterium]|nr:MAG: CRISPR-associated endonuclease Cas1 [Candidatus Dadabacteria bacterium]
MGTLYIDKHAELVRLRGATLVIGRPGARCASIPLHLVERVVIQGDVSLTSSVIAGIASAGASVVLLSGRHGRRAAFVHGRLHNDASTRIAQYRCYLDVKWRTRWAARIVTAKIRGHLVFLREKLGARPDRRRALTRAVEHLVSAIATLREAQTGDALSLDAIRGVEGAASRVVFEALAALLPAETGFRGRNRRPPRDPVNACLSLSYTLAHYDAVRVACVAGLDPYIGFYHDLSYGRESLACDLVELVRPAIDRFVCRLFNEQELRARDFSMDAGGCFMKKSARERFYPLYETFAQHPRRLMRRAARLLVRRIVAHEVEDETGLDDDVPVA